MAFPPTNYRRFRSYTHRRIEADSNGNTPPRSTTRARYVCLFLGQVILRKGIARLFQAARLLKHEPVDIRLVGPTDITNLATLMRGLPISWHGSVPRSDVGRHYQDADVLIFPTLSDGFAITQLEAQEWKLPVITTNRCGSVIRNDVDGIVLDDPTPEHICQAIVRISTRAPVACRHVRPGTR